MTGRKNRKAYVQGTKKALFFLTALLFYLLAVLYHQRLYENGGAGGIALAGSFPDTSTVREILREEKEQETPFDSCFYESLGYQRLEDGGKERRCESEVVALLGSADLYDRQMTGFAQEDREGCILGGKTAWELFGSRAVVGKQVIWKDTAYTVRQVLSGQEDLFLVHPREEITFHSLFLRAAGSSFQEQTRNFLMRHGLTGELSQGELLQLLARLFLFLLPLFLAGYFLRRLWKVLGEIKPGIRGRVLGVLATGIFLGLVIFIVGKSITIPREWIPGKWSDFSFWSEKMLGLVTQFRFYIRAPKSYFQAEQLIFFGKSVLCSLCSLLFWRECVHTQIL